MAEQYETLEEFLDAEEIEQQDEDTLLWVALGLAYGIDVFASRIEREIAVLRGSGVGDRAIIQILSDDLRTGGRIFGEFSHYFFIALLNNFTVSASSLFISFLSLGNASVPTINGLGLTFLLAP